MTVNMSASLKRLKRLKNRLNRLSISVRTAVTVNVRLNRLNRLNSSFNRRSISKFNDKNNKDVKNMNYLVKTYRIRTAVTVNFRLNRLNENFRNVKEVKKVNKGRGTVWEILIPILQHFFHFCHIIFDF